MLFDWFQAQGFRQLDDSDPCIFALDCPDGETLTVGIYVDNLQIVHSATLDADGRAPPAADDDAAGAQVRTALRFPMPHDDAASQNSYRVVPWHSISGESSTSQW